MKTPVVLALLALLSTGLSQPTQVFAQAAPPAVRVAGRAVALPPAELAKLPRATVQTHDHDGQPHAYEGIALHELLRAAGVQMDCRGDAIQQVVSVQSRDGYRTVLAIAEVSPDLTTDVVLLADRCDGQPLAAKAGPWQLIVPGDRKPTRWVRQVQAVSVAVPPQEKP